MSDELLARVRCYLEQITAVKDEAQEVDSDWVAADDQLRLLLWGLEQELADWIRTSGPDGGGASRI